MSSVIEYKGYIGSVEFSETDNVFFGKVQGIRSLISYEGTNATELLADFHDAVDSYLDSCAANGDNPEVAYKGSLNIRLKPEIHRRVAVFAFNHNQSLNNFISEAVEAKLASENA